MKLTLHHINLSTQNVEQMNGFYRGVLGLTEESGGLSTLEKNKGYSGGVAFVSDGHIQMHLAQKDVLAGFRVGHVVNPVFHGHIAYRTDGLDTFKAHLEAQGVQYSDCGNAAVAGWRQIFFYDPAGNVIEVHQADE